MAAYSSSAAGGDTAGTTDRFVTITPAVGDLLVVFCSVRANVNTTPTASDNQGGTYTLVQAAEFGTNQHTLSAFVADQLVASAVSTTITVATGSNTSGNVVAVAVSGMSKTGSAAILQSGKDENNAAGATPAVTFGSAVNTSNVTLGAVGNTNNPATMTPPTSWTERQDIGQPTSNVGLEVVTRDSGFTGTTITWGSTSTVVSAAIAIELDGSSSGTQYNISAGAQVATVAGVVRQALLAIADAVATVAGDSESFTAGSGVDDETDFETPGMVIGDWFDQQVGTTMSLATDQSHSSSHSAKVVQTGSAQGSFHTLTSSQTQVLRVWFRVHALPVSNNVNLFQFDTPSAFTIRLQPDGTVRGLFASATAVNYGTVALDVWHSLDVLVDASGTQFTADVRIDGSAKTQALSLTGQTPSNITTLKVANAGADSTTWYSDDYRHTHDSSQYPLSDAGSGTTFFIETDATVAAVVVLVRQGKLTQADSVATTAADKRATTLSTISDSVATTAADKRATTLNTISDSVATTAAVSRAATFLRSAAATVGTTAAAATAKIKLLAISASAAVTAAVSRQGQLPVSDSVATTASVKRATTLSTISDVVATVADVVVDSAVFFFVSVGATVGVNAGIVRQAGLSIRAWLRGDGSGGAGCILGMTNQSLGTVVLADVENLLGRPFVGLRQNQQVTSTSFTQASAQFDLGYVHSFRNIEPHDTNAWPLTLSGNYDTDLNTIITNVTALSSKWTPEFPFIVTWHHEQTVDTGTQQGYPTAGTAQDYIDSYRYVRQLFDDAGATVRKIDGTWNGGNVIFAYVTWAKMFASPLTGQSYNDFDPNQGTSPAPAGTSYYELAGSDIYNPIISAGTMKYGPDPATILDPIVAFAEAQGIRFIIPEFGVDLQGFTDQASKDAKANFVMDFADYLEALGTGPGSCYGVWLTFSDSGGDYRIDDTPESLAAYQYLANKSYFGKDAHVAASVVRQAQLPQSDQVGTTGAVLRASAHAISTSVASVASVARRGSLRAAATVSTVGRIVRKAGIALADAVTTVAAAALRRTIPTSPNPERSNQITVTQEPNQISVQQTVNVVSVTQEPNQTIISNNGVNIITVEEA